jgi:acetolactate synthase-1/2/3 large subunit
VSSNNKQLTGASALVWMLQAYSVKHIFGLCGDTSLPFYDALHGLDHGMEHILTRATNVRRATWPMPTPV